MQEISYDAAIKEAEELEQQKQTAISDQKYTEVLRIVREQRIFYWRVEKILYSAATRHPDLVLLAKNCKPALETLETFLDAQKAALEIQDITTFNRIRENEIQVLKQLFEGIQKKTKIISRAKIPSFIAGIVLLLSVVAQVEAQSTVKEQAIEYAAPKSKLFRTQEYIVNPVLLQLYNLAHDKKPLHELEKQQIWGLYIAKDLANHADFKNTFQAYLANIQYSLEEQNRILQLFFTEGNIIVAAGLSEAEYKLVLVHERTHKRIDTLNEEEKIILLQSAFAMQELIEKNRALCYNGEKISDLCLYAAGDTKQRAEEFYPHLRTKRFTTYVEKTFQESQPHAYAIYRKISSEE